MNTAGRALSLAKANVLLDTLTAEAVQALHSTAEEHIMAMVTNQMERD